MATIWILSDTIFPTLARYDLVRATTHHVIIASGLGGTRRLRLDAHHRRFDDEAQAHAAWADAVRARLQRARAQVARCEQAFCQAERVSAPWARGWWTRRRIYGVLEPRPSYQEP